MGCLLREKVTKGIDKGTCVIYSRGPESLTKMSGNKASCYFLTVVQTCIDRNLALEIKMRLSGRWQNLLGPIVWMCIYSKCVHQFAFVILLLKILSIAGGLEASLSWRKHLSIISIWALTINLAVTMGSIQHSNCLLRFAVYVQNRKQQSSEISSCIPFSSNININYVFHCDPAQWHGLLLKYMNFGQCMCVTGNDSSSFYITVLNSGPQVYFLAGYSHSMG